MNHLLNAKLSAVAFASLLLALCGQSQAATTWQLGGCNANGTTTKTCGVDSDGVTATFTAYSSDPGAASGNFRNSGDSLTTFQQWGSGVGIISKDPTSGASDESSDPGQPDHAIDNRAKPGADTAELVHISFSKAVSLTSIATSWTWSDSDAVVFRWNGTDDPTLTDYSLSSMTGWTEVAAGQFASGSSNGGSLSVNTTLYSSHWLVSTALLSLDGYVDAFKLKSFTAAVCTNDHKTCTPTTPPESSGVPEPGTLWLAALAAAAIFGRKHLPRLSLGKQALLSAA